MITITKQVKDNIKNFLNDIDDYAFEIMATDIWCLYNFMNNDISYENIYITQKVRDLGIDSIIIPQNNIAFKERYHYLLQISKSSKNDKNIKNFMDEKSMKKYYDIIPIDCKNEKRILITLKKSNIHHPNLEVISDENLLDIICEVGMHYKLLDDCGKFSKEYICNVELRTELWELINIYRKKQKYELVNEYLKVLMANYKLIQQRSFQVLSSMNFIIEQKMKETLEYITSRDDKEKYKIIIMTKFSVVADNVFLKYIKDVEQLVKFILEYVCYDMSRYELVPRCSYLALKNRKNNLVIAYFSYGYNTKETKSFNFGFKCKIEEIDKTFCNNKKIRDANKEEKISDSCSFKTPILLNNPDLINDKELIKELLIKSEISVLK